MTTSHAWTWLLLLLLLVLPSRAATPLITEFMAANLRTLPDDDGEASDWIELHNPTTNTIDLANWCLTDNPDNLNKWRFPSTNLGPSAYLVVFASNKDRCTPGRALHTNFKLEAKGEFLGLVAPDGTLAQVFAPAFPQQADDISYGLGQDYASTKLLAQGTLVRARVPLSAADYSLNMLGWQTNAAFNDTAWRNLFTGAGYDTDMTYGSLISPSGNLQSLLLNSNASFCLRVKFSATNLTAITSLRLRMKYDDGFAAWLNGQLVASNFCPATLAWNSTASAERDDNENDHWQIYYLDWAIPRLTEGTNLLALQGLNVRASSSDMLLLPELEIIRGQGGFTGEAVYFTVPTPGALNTAGATNLGPIVTEVTRDPAQRPTGRSSSPPLAISARVCRTLRDISSVRLYFRAMFNPESSLLMRDDGVAPDVLAGDGLYTVNLPTTIVPAGQMLRWRVVATDTANTTFNAPAFSDPFDSEQYYGTVALGAEPVSNLPLLQWFVQNPAAADTLGGTRCSFFYLGRFYDNAAVSLHGQSTAGGGFPKKSHNVDFARDNRFTMKAGQGKVKDIKLLTNYADKSKVRNTLAYETYRRSGTPYCVTFPVRVHLNGAFFGILDLVEDTDDRYLERQGLDPDGAFYKIYDTLSSVSTAEKKTRLYEDNSDLQMLITQLDTARALDLRRTYAYDQLNLPATVNFLAAHAVVQNNDHGMKNFLMYRDSNGTREWWPVPWDVDLTFGHIWTSGFGYFWNDIICTNRLQSGSINRLYRLVFDSPELNAMFVRRVRTLMDTLLKPPGTPAAQLPLEAQVTALMLQLDPSPTHTPGTSDADADFVRWGSWPSTNPGTCRDECGRITNLFLPGRRAFLYDTNPATRPMSGSLSIPAAQPANVAGLTLEQIEFNPASRNQLEEYFLIRNTNAFAVDLTGWQISGAVDFTCPPGTVLPAGGGLSQNIGLLHVARNPAAFRARAAGPAGGQKRLVVGPYAGQLSARGETLYLRDPAGRLVATNAYRGAPSPLQQFLRITELMYHPDPLPGSPYDAQEGEYLELVNLSTNLTLHLQGAYFTNGLTFAFTNATLLGPQQRLLLVKNPAAFRARYGSGLPLAGPYEGYLDNGGERLTLLDAFNEEVLDFSYQSSWYPTTDGLGFSLVVVDEQAEPDAWDTKAQWRPSGSCRGSPGSLDPVRFQAPVLINEVLAHTDPPQVDTIELFNPNAFALDIGGWFLTDNFFTPRKYRLPAGTRLSAGGFARFDETQFNAQANPSNNFRLGSTGDAVWLFAADAQTNLTGYVHGFAFGATANGVTLGRLVTSAGEEHFVAQAADTLGTNNAGPRVGPVVISAIMYHPPNLLANGEALDNTAHEFVALRNVTGTNVPFYDLARTTNVWRLRGGIDYLFPSNTTLAPGGQLLVVSFAPANTQQLTAFRTQWALDTNLPVLGPWSGQLANRADDLQLERPDSPDLDGTVPFILVERVRYADGPPWPVGADGTGAALERVEPAAYGDDPANWTAAAPPGSQPPDSDGDGLPDWWELAHRLRVDLHDAAQDADGDGLSNGQEWRARLDPQDPASVLRLVGVAAEPGTLRLGFAAMAHVGYTIQSAGQLSPPDWATWQQVPPAATNRWLELTHPAAAGGRFYRLVTPQVP